MCYFHRTLFTYYKTNLISTHSHNSGWIHKNFFSETDLLVDFPSFSLANSSLFTVHVTIWLMSTYIKLSDWSQNCQIKISAKCTAYRTQENFARRKLVNLANCEPFSKIFLTNIYKFTENVLWHMYWLVLISPNVSSPIAYFTWMVHQNFLPPNIFPVYGIR